MAGLTVHCPVDLVAVIHAMSTRASAPGTCWQRGPEALAEVSGSASAFAAGGIELRGLEPPGGGGSGGLLATPCSSAASGCSHAGMSLASSFCNGATFASSSRADEDVHKKMILFFMLQ